MKKAMISQPMANLSDDEIMELKEKAMRELESLGYEVINTLFDDEDYTDDSFSEEGMNRRGVLHIPVYYLAKSLEAMSSCHVVYFCKGWEKARGCKLEHDVALVYGMEIIYER